MLRKKKASYTAWAWLDDNGDGVWDKEERPLPGKPFGQPPNDMALFWTAGRVS
ncbi:MAG: hypothetical protein HND44_13660 [Chloroflexi bacterium]|nr:hypothetical protein [Ardenticatenaceae bacterium]NOG35603.1 hypothetical protein [Chloroflexota bacterium]GIK58515.1 MAG: hypothetical protein BroJett015_41780 [Chloroflexota bacterium]